MTYGPEVNKVRSLIQTSALGICLKMVVRRAVKMAKVGDMPYPDVISPLDRVIFDTPQNENQWGSGGVNMPETGPHFGCIHHEPAH